MSVKSSPKKLVPFCMFAFHMRAVNYFWHSCSLWQVIAMCQAKHPLVEISIQLGQGLLLGIQQSTVIKDKLGWLCNSDQGTCIWCARSNSREGQKLQYNLVLWFVCTCSYWFLYPQLPLWRKPSTCSFFPEILPALVSASAAMILFVIEEGQFVMPCPGLEQICLFLKKTQQK